jgi:prevent-host-death family protein
LTNLTFLTNRPTVFGQDDETEYMRRSLKMNVATRLTTFSAKDAKARFGELLDAALGGLVGITKHDRLTAYVVSKRDFEALVERVQELEDQLWLAKADAARKSGYVGSEHVDALLSRTGDVDDEEVKNHEGRGKGVGGS